MKSEKDRRRCEKLALQLKTIRQARALLEKKLVKTKAERKPPREGTENHWTAGAVRGVEKG